MREGEAWVSTASSDDLAQAERSHLRVTDAEIEQEDVLLSSVQLYKRDIAVYERYAILTPKQREAYKREVLLRVHAGDGGAREEMILFLLSGVVRLAECYLLAHGWSQPGLELGDLIQAGNLILLEKWERALTKHDPFAYLFICAQNEIRNYYAVDRLIPAPRTRAAKVIDYVSLDEPRSGAGARTLVEVLAAPAAAPETQRDDSPLSQALDALPEQQRRVVLRHYGLGGHPAQELCEIDRELYGGKKDRSHTYERQAFYELCCLLKPCYPQYYPEAGAVVPCTEPVRLYAYEQIQLSDQEEERLTAACERLRARGTPVTWRNLEREAHIDGPLISAYLRQHGMGRQQADPAERLGAAYARMQAQGRPLRARELGQEAQVHTLLARCYLRQLGVYSKLDRKGIQLRLEHAYEAMQAQGEPLRAGPLAKRASVTKQVAANYLKQRSQAVAP
jgi:RNA polymerase sigma factor (sigma-70 family)